MWAQTLNPAPLMVGSGNQARDHAAGPDSVVVSSTGDALSPNTATLQSWLLHNQLETVQSPIRGLPSQVPLSLHSVIPCFVFLFPVYLKSPTTELAQGGLGRVGTKGDADSPRHSRLVTASETSSLGSSGSPS